MENAFRNYDGFAETKENSETLLHWKPKIFDIDNPFKPAYKIIITCVVPGSIVTQFFEQSGLEAHSNMLQPKDNAAFIIHVLKTP